MTDIIFDILYVTYNMGHIIWTVLNLKESSIHQDVQIYARFEAWPGVVREPKKETKKRFGEIRKAIRWNAEVYSDLWPSLTRKRSKVPTGKSSLAITTNDSEKFFWNEIEILNLRIFSRAFRSFKNDNEGELKWKKLDNINLHVQEIDSKIRRNIEDKQKVDELSDRLRELEGSLNRKSYPNSSLSSNAWRLCFRFGPHD